MHPLLAIRESLRDTRRAMAATGRCRRRIRVGSPAVALVLASSLAGLSAAPAGASEEAERGRWTSPFWEGGSTPFDPPSAERSRRYPSAATVTVLPDRRILYWNALEASENGELWVGHSNGTIILENSRVRLLGLGRSGPEFTTSVQERGTTDDAQAGAATQDLFCADQKLLHDGRVLVAGGSRWDVPEDTRFPEPRGVADARVFDPADDRFRPVEAMREPRWYPSLVTLPDGRVSVTSGVRRAIATAAGGEPSMSQVRLTEIYDPATERWLDGGESEWSFPLYPRLHLLPDGTVFYGGAGQSWNPFGETADQASWSQRRVYEPEERRWSSAGQARYGVRSGAASVMLRLEPPYDHADILMAGGTLGSSPGAWMATTLSEVVRWTPEGITDLGAPRTPLAGLGSDRSQLRHRRWFGTPVLLPTGEVFLVNGGDADDVVDPGSAAAVRTPELYDPRSGTWTELAPTARDRVYHSSAVLLADGRVLIGGHAPHPAHYFRYGNETTRANNFRDATFEIYEPPYLFRGSRPRIKRVKAVRRGRALRLRMRSRRHARRVAEVVLVRMGSNTHAMDGDLRAVSLRRTRRGRRVNARLPRGGDGRLLPPGPYFVWAVRRTSRGPIPSVAKVAFVKPAGGDRVVVSTRGRV